MRRTLHYKFALLKGQIAIKTKSLLTGKILCIIAEKLSFGQKKSKSFGGKIVPGKKKSALLNCV